MTDIAKSISTNVTEVGKVCPECDMWSGRHLRTCSALVTRSPEAQKIIQAAVSRGVSAADAIELFRAGWRCGHEVAVAEHAGDVSQVQGSVTPRFYRR